VRIETGGVFRGTSHMAGKPGEKKAVESRLTSVG
jgi:hypothetical protein